jgi:NDP-sugar pyrophosphorylase family protein
MVAMIFAAGLGTRFKPWTDQHPKALARVHNIPLLEHNIKYLQQYGISEIVINVHHFADQVIEALQENNGWGSNFRISDESAELLETGGGLLNARSLFPKDEQFLTINADILTDIPLNTMLEFHNQQKALISLAVTNRPSTRNFLFDEKNNLCGWENRSTGEKKIMVDALNLIPMSYSCVAIYEPNVFDLIPQSGKFSLTETFLSLASSQKIIGFDHSGGRFIDVGKPESVAIAESLFPNVKG